MSKHTLNAAIKTSEPDWLKPNFENIPEKLRKQPWAVWKAEPRSGQPNKFNKAPLNPLTGLKVGANQPEKFGTFEQAKKAYETGKYTGVGVLLTGNGIAGIDLDDVATLLEEKPQTKEWLKQAIKSGAYCEFSPSNTGLRLFVLGTLASTGRNGGGLEIYDNKRFLTITGGIFTGKGGTK